MFWVLNKKTNDPAICGSVVALSSETGIDVDKFYEHFGRKKKKEHNDSNYRICKLPVIKAKRK